MKIYRYLYISLLVVIISIADSVNAQDPHFSQFYANYLYLNPAFAGAVRCPRMTLNYRNQWPALGSAYVTYSASYDQHVDELEGGLGALLINDVQADGAITTTIINGIYTYTLNVNRTLSITGGFQATYIQKKLNWDFIFPDMMHPLYGPIFPTHEDFVPTDKKIGIWDFSTGFIGFTRRYFGGIACHHLTEPQESWRNSSSPVLPRKWTVHFGTEIPLRARRFKRGELSISPNILFQQQQNYQQMDYGIYLNRNSIVGGIWMRHNVFGKLAPHADSFIMLLGFIQSKIKFAYSYDLTISKLKNSTLGAHEVSFSMIFNCRQKRKKFRSISCPSF